MLLLMGLLFNFVSSSTEIYMGQSSERDEFSHHVGIRVVFGNEEDIEGLEYGEKTYSQFCCGGTLIHPRLVLTASHCVKNDDIFKDLNGDRLISGFEIVLEREEIESRLYNPKYIDIGGELNSEPDAIIEKCEFYETGGLIDMLDSNDIALCLLDKPVTHTTSGKKILFPAVEDDLEYPFDEEDCLLVGWGMTEHEDGIIRKRHTNVPLVSYDRCSLNFGVIFEDESIIRNMTETMLGIFSGDDEEEEGLSISEEEMDMIVSITKDMIKGIFDEVEDWRGRSICGGDGRSGACPGDSGSGLICRSNGGYTNNLSGYKLIGVVNRGNSSRCDAGFTKFTFVNYYSEWINEKSKILLRGQSGGILGHPVLLTSIFFVLIMFLVFVLAGFLIFMYRRRKWGGSEI